jgi:hypothetical protein
MRMTAPAIGGSAVVLAAALVWLFQPEPHAVVEGGPELEREPAAVPVPAVSPDAAPVPEPRARDSGAVEPGANPPPRLERAPLPGELPQTPMAELVTERQNLIVRRDGAGATAEGATPDIVAGELAFAAEPIDSTWAAATEAEVLGKFAQMPGLRLIDLQVECRSTMCRIELTQPNDGALDGSPLSFNILRDSLGLEPRWMMMVGSGSTALRSVGYFWRAGFAPQRESAEPERAN